MFKKTARFTLVMIVFGLIFGVMSVGAQTSVTDTLLADFETLIESEMEFFDIPGAAVAIIEGDEVVYAEGFGLRDMEQNAPFTTETRFRIGSTTKSMTSLMIAQLVDEGVLSWDTPVTDIFPDFATADPDLTAQITLRDLMGMGTGLVSSPFAGFQWDGWEVDALLEGIAAQSIEADFREAYSYNNEVYALAGYAGAVASGLEPTLENYTTLMQERVFDPIGMDSAIITDDMGELGENYSQSYETSILTGEPVVMTDPTIGVIAPAGAVWANIEDMARYVITQMNGGITPDGTRIVSEAALEETWQPGVALPMEAAGIEDSAYGMGWVTQAYQGVPMRYHDGGWAGYNTQMVIFPEDGVAIIIFANGTYGGFFGQALTYAFAEHLHDLESAAIREFHDLIEGFNEQIDQFRPLISTEIEDASALVGDYTQGWSVEQRDDGSLWAARGEWEFQLGYVAMLDLYFAISGGSIGIPFDFDTEGDTTTFTIQLSETQSLQVERIE